MALRVLSQVYRLADKRETAALKRPSGDSGRAVVPLPTNIRIVTDSNYAYELLQSADKLLEWGSKPTFADFVYTGKGSDWAANVDVIYPLSRTYSGFLDKHSL